MDRRKFIAIAGAVSARASLAKVLPAQEPVSAKPASGRILLRCAFFCTSF